MKKFILIFFMAFLLYFPIVFLYSEYLDSYRLQEDETSEINTKNHMLFERKNKKYGLTAKFYGLNLLKYPRTQFYIRYIVIENEFSKNNIIYTPKYDKSNPQLKRAFDNIKDEKEDLYIVDGNFYNSEIWSPDGEKLVLPISEKDGFAVFNAETAVADIKTSAYADTIRVSSKDGPEYFHSFVKWEGPSSFSFRADLYDSVFPYNYNISAKKVSCYGVNCKKLRGSHDRATNHSGDLVVNEIPETQNWKVRY
jgi:hypothetical protein